MTSSLVMPGISLRLRIITFGIGTPLRPLGVALPIPETANNALGCEQNLHRLDWVLMRSVLAVKMFGKPKAI
jgi:hypothetical protein